MPHSRELTHPNLAAFPRGVSGPALRALARAGVVSLEALTTWTEPDLAALHGMGPKVLGVLTTALAERGLQLQQRPR